MENWSRVVVRVLTYGTAAGSALGALAVLVLALLSGASTLVLDWPMGAYAGAVLGTMLLIDRELTRRLQSIAAAPLSVAAPTGTDRGD